MAKSKRSEPHRTPAGAEVPSIEVAPMQGTGLTTGRYLVLFREKETTSGLKVLRESAGLEEVASAADFTAGAMDLAQVAGSDVVVFDKLGVALVNGDPHQVGSVAAAAAEDSAILAVEPERMNFAAIIEDMATPAAAASAPISLEYLRGFRDAVNELYDRLSGTAGPALAEGLPAGITAPLQDNAQYTWGLQATRVPSSRRSGTGIRIAILDTGLDLSHPDFLGRVPDEQQSSFVPGQAVQDGHGHGTHTAGTACGVLHPGSGRRYGVAYAAQLFVGKVLSNAGSGPDGGIIAGINWAVTNRCQVISMSLGSPVPAGETFSPIYENLARRALAAGTLIIAAAGNESQRPSSIAPVGRPANSPSILAVAAVDSALRVGVFSNGGINADGGGVDVSGPGVAVYSSWPVPTRYRSISGTSMATPHVAGIAGLWSQARGVTGGDLWQALTGSALRLPLPARDVGSGLVQAPVP